eukprot:749784-Rhodomonas_salina.1
MTSARSRTRGHRGSRRAITCSSTCTNSSAASRYCQRLYRDSSSLVLHALYRAILRVLCRGRTESAVLAGTEGGNLYQDENKKIAYRLARQYNSLDENVRGEDPDPTTGKRGFQVLAKSRSGR